MDEILVLPVFPDFALLLLPNVASSGSYIEVFLPVVVRRFFLNQPRKAMKT